MMKTTIINQALLSPECWIVQFRGLAACETCPEKDTEECGGKKIRETGKNEHGHLVPLGTGL
jgi:hypothetical protein